MTECLVLCKKIHKNFYLQNFKKFFHEISYRIANAYTMRKYESRNINKWRSTSCYIKIKNLFTKFFFIFDITWRYNSANLLILVLSVCMYICDSVQLSKRTLKNTKAAYVGIQCLLKEDS